MVPLTGPLPDYTVTEISLALKRSVEGTFSHVRVRGEISGLKRHSSGHTYFALKDQEALLDGVCWRGSCQSSASLLQEGLEIIATGRLTTYPGRSKYQIVVTHVEAAGEGALQKFLEDLKKRLAAEGLFAESLKKPLPFLPQTIGIITSPTGAVIRDILHRLGERFPVSVLLWPVAVQGEGAGAQVVAALEGFNGMDKRPDLLIVARGGGSLEDLWAFNEEGVVRAIAASEIPVISAIGHETDITLADFAADKRAPTPTAAAEFAVPVRTQLAQNLAHHQTRLTTLLQHSCSLYESRLEALRRGLPSLGSWVDERSQKVDELSERVMNAGRRLCQQSQLLLDHQGQRLDAALPNFIAKAQQRFEIPAQLLFSYSYTRTLERGFAFVTGADGMLIGSKSEIHPPQEIAIHFHDGAVEVKAV